ncbi:hypothetical protein [Ruegeria atlantica]|uniref:hypothetical protein n=1 Tax=Ruegeria atlantica TaxID=81569 RepID=UPI00147B52AB|nr:hypothetical protein [Ruegeria atlantica]
MEKKAFGAWVLLALGVAQSLFPEWSGLLLDRAAPAGDTVQITSTIFFVGAMVLFFMRTQPRAQAATAGEYDIGYADGQLTKADDWDRAFIAGSLNLDEQCEIDPSAVSDALADILSSDQTAQRSAEEFTIRSDTLASFEGSRRVG